MKIKWIVLLVILLAILAALSIDFWSQGQAPAASMTPTATASMPKEKLPDFSFTATDNQIRTMHALPETGIVLHFWATWCAPCRVELPRLLKRIAEANGRLALVAVSTDDDRAAMERFLAQQKIEKLLHVYWVWDEAKAISLTRFNTVSVPETILIDNQRMMVDKIVGDPDWTSKETGQRLEALNHPARD